MRFRSLHGALALVAALSGCAAVPPAPETPAAAISGKELVRFQISGRVSVKYDGQGFSGSLRWRHEQADDDLLLLSPLGQGVARVARDASGVALTDSDGHIYQAPDAESLTEEVLGWRLPLRGLRYWVAGVPAPGDARLERDPSGRLARLAQDGWQVDYLGYQAVAGQELPRRMELQHGDVEIRLLLDEWDLSNQ